MTVSSRTPEGEPHRCAICGELAFTEPSQPLGDSVCPRCGALLAVVSEQLGVERKQIDENTSFNDLGADSLDTVVLIMEIEEEFDIQIPDDEAEKIKTVGDAIRAILRRQDQSGEAA